MVDGDRETRELFIEESLEGLQRVEELLLAAESGAPSKDLVDTLFRDFHTIKGTAGFLGLAQIGRLAHASEDLLGLLRDRQSSGAGGPLPDLTVLIPVVDKLRAMVGCVREIDEEGDHDLEEVMNDLADAQRVLRQGPEDPEASPASGGSQPAPPASSPSTPVSSAPPPPASAPAPPAARPPAPPTLPSAGPKLGEVLVKGGCVTEQQLNQALATQRAYLETHSDGGEPPKLGAILVAQGVITEGRLAAALESQRAEGVRAADSSDGTVRVNVAVLDRLMNLMGELVLARNQVTQILKNTKDSVNAQAAGQRLALVTSEVQEQVMKTRMQPVARVFDKLPRMVRDLCKWTGKKANCQIVGTATEIDKALAEAIRDPVMHIVRNAMDHGIETPDVREAAGKRPVGTLTVRAFHDGGLVTIEISDDGAGMDPEKIKAHAVRRGILTLIEAERMTPRQAIDLLFRPGFSTAEKVTSISGRGVGMDVVRSHLERAGGQVDVESVVGVGTTIRLKMPLTLAIIPALLVDAGGQLFAIPQVNLQELVYLEPEQLSTAIEHVRGAKFYRLRGEILPLVSLDDMLGLPDTAQADNGLTIVVVQIGAARYGLVVDAVYDTEEIVIKPLHRGLKRLSVYSGAAVLGNGAVALILDVGGVAAGAGIEASRAKQAQEARPVDPGAYEPYLIFTAGNRQTCAVSLGLVARLEQIDPRTIEHVAGREVVQYQGSIMPILRAENLIALGEAPPVGDAQQLIVFDFGDKVAMAVGAIIDIVSVPVQEAARRMPAPHTLGHRIVAGSSTLLLDVFSMIAAVLPDYAREKPVERPRRRILLADDSATMRAAVSGFLRAAGLEVVEVASGAAALTQVRGGTHFDAVVTDLEMQGVDGFGVLDAVKREQPAMPVFVWTRHDDPAVLQRARDAGAAACVNKGRRESLIAALLDFGLGPSEGARLEVAA